MSAEPTAAPTTGKALNITLWVLQGLLALFFLVAASGPKLFGEQTAVQLFEDIGAGQWLRYVVGLLELAGAIGLVVPRLAGLAALGLCGLMIGAGFTQLVVLNDPVLAITPVILLVLAGFIAWGRRAQTTALLTGLRRS